MTAARAALRRRVGVPSRRRCGGWSAPRRCRRGTCPPHGCGGTPGNGVRGTARTRCRTHRRTCPRGGCGSPADRRSYRCTSRGPTRPAPYGLRCGGTGTATARPTPSRLEGGTRKPRAEQGKPDPEQVPSRHVPVVVGTPDGAVCPGGKWDNHSVLQRGDLCRGTARPLRVVCDVAPERMARVGQRLGHVAER